MMTSDPTASFQIETTRRYPDLEALSRELAKTIALDLSKAIESRGLASLVVPGGRTPVQFFGWLRTQELDWSRVCVALADERWVDPSDPYSNEKLVRETLLQGPAAKARFIGLKNAAPTPDMGAVSAWETFARVPRPFDRVILGMGDDGHTASLFPGSPNLPHALNPNAAAACVAMRAPVEPQARLSLNLSALLDARGLILLINGESKWQRLVTACAPGEVADMPVRGILNQQRAPISVLWSP
jgi:6-phosphogluconolactonase